MVAVFSEALSTAGPGIFFPFILNILVKDQKIPSSGGSFIKNKRQAETWIVREQTPITLFISKKVDGKTAISICSEQIMSGNGIPVHKHLNEDEYFYFLSGESMFQPDEKEIEVGPGSVAFVPKNTWHRLKNTGNNPLVFIFEYSPTGFEDFFRKIAVPEGQPFVPKPKSEILKWAAHYGMVYK